MELITIAGETSYRIQSDKVTLCVTRSGGQIGPVIFELSGRTIAPFSVAPWCGTFEAKGLPNILKALRGDFFCMPFGTNAASYEGENHPLHGETANSDWRLEPSDANALLLSLVGNIRPYVIRKEIVLVDGHSAVYQRHIISKLEGLMNYGHHAMLHYPGDHPAGRVSVSPFAFGQVFPGEFESAADGGYSSLKPGATFPSLSAVPMANGTTADLSRYPAREGFEDLVMVSANPSSSLAWSAATLPRQGAFWLSLKCRRDFPSTILWHSNGGRHYPPWNGRHRGVIGIEEVCAYFHYGLAESAAANPVSNHGIPTARAFHPHDVIQLPYIMAIGELPSAEDAVEEVYPTASGVDVRFESGAAVRLPLDLTFLKL